MKTHLSICIVVWIAFAGSALAQAPLKPRATVTKPAKTKVDRSKHDAERIYVKFRDDAPVRLRQGKLAAVGAKADALSAATGLLDRLAAACAKWERQHSVSEEKLSEMREKAQRNTGKAMADLNAAYILRVRKGADAGKLIDELNALEIVELAEPMPLPAPDPVAGNYEPQQGYLDPAPEGLDVEYAWSLDGGAGFDVWVADIESNWNFNHTDLTSPTLLGAASTLTGQNNIDHGTAVLGVLGGLDNGVGVSGIAYNSTFFVAARQTAAGFNPAGAITTAAATLRAGDIMLLEMQTDGPFTLTDGAGAALDLVPVEWVQSVYDAVRTAVGNGIVIVAAAGNGSQNLDDPAFNTGHAPFLTANDSGAIIVGAGGTTGGSGSRTRLDFSTFGSTVDLQGWGEGVVTTGYGDLFSTDGANSLYTATFNGTSSASATIAGVCAVLQSRYKFTHNGAVLTPFQVREILRATGSPQLDGEEAIPGSFVQNGTTVTRQTGAHLFTIDDLNAIIRFSTGEEAPITAIVSTTQVTVATSQNLSPRTIVLSRPATQNIGPRPNLRAAMDYVGDQTTWVDFAYGGPEDGSISRPFNTVPEGVAAVPDAGTLIFKAGTSNWTGTITKPMTLRALATATIGQ
jgi:hypothetical protein